MGLAAVTEKQPKRPKGHDTTIFGLERRVRDGTVFTKDINPSTPPCNHGIIERRRDLGCSFCENRMEVHVVVPQTNGNRPAQPILLHIFDAYPNGKMSKTEAFSNRWGIVLASLGMAVGAGNLWRFPRLAGQYGGSFILLWIVFLFVWSIPLLLAEFSIGKAFRRGVIGSFAAFSGRATTWMGFFITVCTLGIAFYYAVVTAWALQYLGISLSDIFSAASASDKHLQTPAYLENQWESIANNNVITVGLYIAVVSVGIFVLSKGIRKGLEKANRVLIPSLFGLLLVIALLALQLPNGITGLEYMFSIQWDLFREPRVWIEALSQSAWSTGAGWGLLMTLSSYSRAKEDVTLNTFIGAFGNNTASLVAGMAIIPSVFALAGSEGEALAFLQAGNQSLTFIIIPQLFANYAGGGFLSVIFFLALFFAAFSSLLPMIQLCIGNLVHLGLTHGKALAAATIAFIAAGFPSAVSLNFFNNQDWVWGLGLIISGLFILFAVAKYGSGLFKDKLIDNDSQLNLSRTYFSVCVIVNIFLGIFLIYWWLSQGYSDYPWFDANGVWNVTDVYSNASVITQWGAVIIIGIVLNGFLYKKFYKAA